MVGLHPARRPRSGAVGPVVEPHFLSGTDGGAQCEQDVGVGLGISPAPGRLDRGDPEGVDTLPQTGRQDLAHRREGTRGGLLDARSRPDRDPQRHGCARGSTRSRW